MSDYPVVRNLKTRNRGTSSYFIVSMVHLLLAAVTPKYGIMMYEQPMYKHFAPFVIDI